MDRPPPDPINMLKLLWTYNGNSFGLKQTILLQRENRANSNSGNDTNNSNIKKSEVFYLALEKISSPYFPASGVICGNKNGQNKKKSHQTTKDYNNMH
jgi:hypothetical protein